MTSLLAVALSFVTLLPMFNTQKQHERQPAFQYFFGMSASPTQPLVAAYAAPGKPDGDYVVGSPVLIRFGTSLQPTVEILKLPKALDTSTFPVWTADGERVFFSTDKGIYLISARGTTATRVVFTGTTAGLAVSRDGKLVAFWNLKPRNKSLQYQLTVLDLGTETVVRTWDVPVKFEGDKYGFDLQFGSEGEGLYAKTFDSAARPSIKHFDLRGGTVESVCLSGTSVTSMNGVTYALCGGKRLLKLGSDAAAISIKGKRTLSRIRPGITNAYSAKTSALEASTLSTSVLGS